MKLSMDKQKHTNGFTLIEMLIVLLLISFCLLLFPIYQPYQDGRMHMQMERLRQELLQVQTKAIHEKRHMKVQLQGNRCITDEREIELAMQCQGSLSFNPSGNVNRAMSIDCTLGTAKGTLVILLGSGRMYVK